MEPIPATAEALRELTRYGDTDVARRLHHLSRDVVDVIPQVVGLSLSLIEEQLTFTMSATSGPVAELDGLQYLAGGPCDQTLRTGRATTYRADDPVDEQQWQVFARATAAAGIASTLSLPILRGEEVVAGVNIYASTPTAFHGHEEELADICGASSEGATLNADLAFRTRLEAAEPPDGSAPGTCSTRPSAS